VEFEDLEITASCSNPFLQIWKGGVKPVFDSKDDLWMIANIAKAVGDEIGDKRFTDYLKFEHVGKRRIYIQRLLDSCTTTAGYKLDDIMAGKYGTPGGALMLFRTYPRIPFWEQVHKDEPFHTDTGRLHAYADVPEAIEYGENFIVHREGTEATPYLPNVIVSSNPHIRPQDYGIPMDAEHWDAHGAEHQDALARSSRRGISWEKGLILLHYAQDAAPRALVVEQRRLAHDLRQQLRRSDADGPARALRRRAPDSPQPAGRQGPGDQ
jgi:nitrate reductase alpha subunit